MLRRNVIVHPIGNETYMAMACDVAAGIGSKPHDVLSVDVAVTGAYCVRVVLVELLSIGASPIAFSHVVGSEYNPTAKRSLEGVRAELERAGLGDIPVTGSSENNMTTSMTTVGVTGVGLVPQRPTRALGERDGVYLVGQPLVGEEVLKYEEGIVSYDTIRRLYLDPSVKYVLPVGSSGIQGELDSIFEITGLQCDTTTGEMELDVLQKSGGPATAVIVCVEAMFREHFENQFPFSTLIGVFRL